MDVYALRLTHRRRSKQIGENERQSFATKIGDGETQHRGESPIGESMKYMIHVEVSVDAVKNMEQGDGPGQLVGYIAEKFKPDSMHFGLSRRAIYMIADLDETQLCEAMVVLSTFAGAHPEVTAVAPLEDFGGFAASALAALKEAPMP